MARRGLLQAQLTVLEGDDDAELDASVVRFQIAQELKREGDAAGAAKLLEELGTAGAQGRSVARWGPRLATVELYRIAVERGDWDTSMTALARLSEGKEAGPFECRGVGLYDMTSVVGGFGDGKQVDEYTGANGWFEGYLSAISVSHSPHQ